MHVDGCGLLVMYVGGCGCMLMCGLLVGVAFVSDVGVTY